METDDKDKNAVSVFQRNFVRAIACLNQRGRSIRPGASGQGNKEFLDLSAFSSSSSDLLACICFNATSNCF